MIRSPTKAGTKIYKFDEKEIKPEIIDLIQANGASALSLAVAEMLLSFTSIEYSRAAVYAMLPRVCFLLYSMAQRSKFGEEFTTRSNLIRLAVATSLLEGRWMGETLSMQMRGGFYLCLGVLFMIAPNFVAKRSKQFDANPTTERCLRARAKMDLIFGALIYNLASVEYTRALGFGSVVWFVSSLYGDFIVSSRDRFRSDAFVQLLIASVSAGVLLMT